MTTYIRHGDGEHVVRPDRTIRTGVVPPLYGFNPVQDVMANANVFTLGPYVYTQDSTNPASARGIAGTPQLMGPLKRWWMGVKANRLAKRMARGLHGVVPNGPASVMGPQVVPMMAGRPGLLAMMAEQHFPPSWGHNAAEMIANRWNGRNPYR